MTKRDIAEPLSNDLPKKIVLLSGPRQVGKTTLSKSLTKNFDYLNFDNDSDRIAILNKRWDRDRDLLILDEIHKMRNWKRWLKGIYDVEGLKIPILVTGSARLDVLKKAGDSLAGRHFHYRLHPLDPKELKNHHSGNEIFKGLMSVGGFPEPYFNGTPGFYNRWRRSHLDLILKQDLLSLDLIRDISTFETMVLLLQSRVGSPLSFKSLAEDLHKDTKTIQKWITIAESLYILFLVRPFSKNIARSILKEPKFYMYDLGRLDVNEGIKLENLAALSLRKQIDFGIDALGEEATLHTLRVKGGQEIDFLILRKGKRPILIEVKLSESGVSTNFNLFRKYFPGGHFIQLVRNLTRETTTPDGIQIREVIKWLSHLDLQELD